MGESGESLLYLFRDDIDSGDEGLSSKNIDKGSSSSTSESDDSITGEGDRSEFPNCCVMYHVSKFWNRRVW